MRLKSELYQKEQSDILDKIIEIIDLDENNQITKMLKSNQKLLAGTTIVIWILIFFVKSK
jgi:hypothetical protein